MHNTLWIETSSELNLHERALARAYTLYNKYQCHLSLVLIRNGRDILLHTPISCFTGQLEAKEFVTCVLFGSKWHLTLSGERTSKHKFSHGDSHYVTRKLKVCEILPQIFLSLLLWLWIILKATLLLSGRVNKRQSVHLSLLKSFPCSTSLWENNLAKIWTNIDGVPIIYVCMWLFFRRRRVSTLDY